MVVMVRKLEARVRMMAVTVRDMKSSLVAHLVVEEVAQ